MARGINKVILVGNLGNDPEHRTTPGGMAVTRASVATTSSRKGSDGNYQDRTEWHRVVFFGRTAEVAAEYLRKGSQVYIEGEIRYDKYTDKEGNERYSTDIVANEMQMLGGRGEGGGGGAPRGERPQRSDDGFGGNNSGSGSGGSYNGGQRSNNSNYGRSQNNDGGNRNPSPPPPPPSGGFDEDDIPF